MSPVGGRPGPDRLQSIYAGENAFGADGPNQHLRHFRPHSLDVTAIHGGPEETDGREF